MQNTHKWAFNVTTTLVFLQLATNRTFPHSAEGRCYPHKCVRVCVIFLDNILSDAGFRFVTAYLDGSEDD